MAIKITDARDLGAAGIVLTADLDALNPDAATDARLFARIYGYLPGETFAQLRQRARTEFRALARQEAAIRAATAPAIPALIGDDIS